MDIDRGHRPQSLPFGFNESDERCVKLRRILKQEVIKLIEEKSVTTFISGMALGIDQICAEIVLELKPKYPQIQLICAIPCETQAVKWNESFRNRYFSIVEQSDKEVLLQKHYTPDCMMKRNEYMVNSSDYIIAVWDGKASGTGNTVHYARTLGKEVVVINPYTV